MKNKFKVGDVVYEKGFEGDPFEITQVDKDGTYHISSLFGFDIAGGVEEDTLVLANEKDWKLKK